MWFIHFVRSSFRLIIVVWLTIQSPKQKPSKITSNRNEAKTVPKVKPKKDRLNFGIFSIQFHIEVVILCGFLCSCDSNFEISFIPMALRNEMICLEIGSIEVCNFKRRNKTKSKQIKQTHQNQKVSTEMFSMWIKWMEKSTVLWTGLWFCSIHICSNIRVC